MQFNAVHKFNGGTVENFFSQFVNDARKDENFPQFISVPLCNYSLYHSYITILASWIIPQNSFHCVPTRTSSHPDQIVPHHYISLPPPPLDRPKRCKSGGLFHLVPPHSYMIPQTPPPLGGPLEPKRCKIFDLNITQKYSHCNTTLTSL